MNLRLVLFLLMIVTGLPAQADRQTVPLWSAAPPVTARIPGQETLEDGRARNVRDPALIPFLLPGAGGAARPAVLIFPGGGYGHLAVEKEGEAAARWANSLGMHAFVVKYRLHQFGAPAPLMDAQQAVRLVRAHAKQWRVDPSKVGIVGFSAGGHVAASLNQHYGQDLFNQLDPPAKPPGTAKLSARPDFAILVYPVITMQDSFAHTGSRAGLLGAQPSRAAIEFYSLEKQVNASSPPTFIVHSSADPVVPIENSLMYWQALRSAGVATEFLAFQFGGHGFGLENENEHTARWPDRAADWLRSNRFLE